MDFKGDVLPARGGGARPCIFKEETLVPQSEGRTATPDIFHLNINDTDSYSSQEYK